MLQGYEGFCNYLYQGQTLDAETGLAYNRFRYYDNEEGVYISQDPIGLLGGSNLYGYVNDSNNLIDPLGLNGMPKGGWNYGNMPKIDGYQNHHVTPRSKADHPAIKAAGFDVDKPSNLIYLPKEAGTHSTRSLHDGWNKGHSDYNAHMQSELDRIYEKGQTKGWGQKDYAAEIDKLRGKTKKDLRKGRISCCS